MPKKTVCFWKICVEGCQADDQNTRAASLAAVGNNGLISHAAHGMLYSAQYFGIWGEKCFFFVYPQSPLWSVFNVHRTCIVLFIWVDSYFPTLTKWEYSHFGWVGTQPVITRHKIVLGPSVCPSVRLMLHLCGFSFFSCHSIFKDFCPPQSMTLKPAPLDFFNLVGWRAVVKY